MHILVQGAHVLKDGKILRVSGDYSLCGVLQTVEFGNQVDDVLMQHVNYDYTRFLQTRR